MLEESLIKIEYYHTVAPTVLEESLIKIEYYHTVAPTVFEVSLIKIDATIRSHLQCFKKG
jgi:hypothetical protein